MHRSQKLSLIAIACTCITAHAQQPTERHPWMDATYSIDGGMAFAGQDTKITVGLDNLELISGEIDFERDLKLTNADNRASMQFRWRFGEKWSLAGQYFGTHRSSSTTLERDISWEDVVYRAGVKVSGGFDYDVTRLLFGRTFFTGPKHEFGAGLGLHWMDLGATLKGEAFLDGESLGSIRKRVSGSAPLPNLGAWYAYSWNPRWMFKAGLDWLDASVGDYSGSLINMRAGVAYQPWRNAGFIAQYNFFNLNVDVSESDWRGDVNAKWDGPYLGLQFNW